MKTMKSVNDIDTPLMNQYKEIKSNYRDAILFFRLGDFYEMFDEDAKIASNILSIALTSRHDVPMCGVPYHSAANYISKLINRGYKVAICEQVGDEDKKTKLFRREVVRVITPGTVIEENLLDNKKANYLASIIIDIIGWGISWIDVSTGEFYSINNFEDLNFTHFNSLISRINPKEIIVDKATREFINKNKINLPTQNITVYFMDNINTGWINEPVWQNNKLALKASLLTLNYIKKVQPDLNFELKPSYYDDDYTLKLDETAIKTLELVESDYEGGYSLIDVLDETKTNMGLRTLRKWVLNPLKDYFQIKQRQDFVGFLYRNPELIEELDRILSDMPDIERLTGKIINLSITPYDAISIKNAISKFEYLKEFLNSKEFIAYIPDIVKKVNSLSKINELKNLIDKSINENSSLKLGEGDLIKKGYNTEYDELKDLIDNTQKIISELELKEREKTNIPSLKIGYNNNFGYYIEVTKTHLSKIPDNYVRKQTLVSSERFITDELKKLEEKIFGANEKIKRLESYLFSDIKKEILNTLDEIKIFVYAVSNLDAFSSLAKVALNNDYVKPEIVEDDIIEIENSRHPVIEKFLLRGSFVPNDININDESRTIILTGPNMSGKSVYLRQTALIVILAQMGSFVPATKAKLGITDRIMTRIGAHDRLLKGESTFMVEMKETSNILKLATNRSLILLDEVGRGTSTFDGISIAYAVLEYLHRKIGAKVLFATHFFEITELAHKYNGIKNYNIAVREWVNSEGKVEISFLHKVVEGPADKSYGVHVAQLAGLPAECIKRAKEILAELESRDIDIKAGEKDADMLPLFSSHPVIDRIRMIDLNKITPIDALNILNELKKEV